VATNAAPSEGWDPSIEPPEILLGILSSDIRLAVRALRDWANALHVPFVIPTSRVSCTNSSCRITRSVGSSVRTVHVIAGGGSVSDHKLARLCIHQV